jgi:hypothetical protein
MDLPADRSRPTSAPPLHPTLREADLVVVQADLALGLLEAFLHHPPGPGHPDQPKQGGASRAQAGVEGQVPIDAAAAHQQPAGHAATAGAARSTRVQSYRRRSLAPWPALAVTHCSAGTSAASRSALVRTGRSAPGIASSSVRLTASTYDTPRPSNQPRRAGSPP